MFQVTFSAPCFLFKTTDTRSLMVKQQDWFSGVYGAEKSWNLHYIIWMGTLLKRIHAVLSNLYYTRCAVIPFCRYWRQFPVIVI